MYLEDVIFWLSTCLLTFGIVATAIYDYILTEVQTGGFVYALISLPVLWYAGLEIIFPKESRKAYMMLMVNEYLKAYPCTTRYGARATSGASTVNHSLQIRNIRGWKTSTGTCVRQSRSNTTRRTTTLWSSPILSSTPSSSTPTGPSR